MAYIVKLGSMSVVARTASEAVRLVERFLFDAPGSEPVVSNFDGTIFDIERLRGLIADIDEA